MDVAAVARQLSDYFEQQDSPFAAIGGYGLIAHGIQRATFDLDLAVPRETQPELIRFLESLGYETLHRSPGYSNHLHADAALGRLDFVYVDESTAETLFSQSSVKEIFEGMSLPVPRPEHLAAMKVQALKNDPSRGLIDLDDLRRLYALPGVDREEIRGYFERAGLLGAFQQIEEIHEEEQRSV